MDPSKIDWWSAIGSALGGAFVAVVSLFGWFGKKLGTVNAKIEALEAAAADCKSHRDVQASMHVDNQRRLQKIEDGVDRLLNIQLGIK